MSPQVIILCVIALGVLVIVWRKLQSNQFDSTLRARGWSELPACPVKVPWPGENRGPVRCYAGELKPGVPCTVLVAQYLRPVNTTRRYSVDPYLGIYVPKEVLLKEDAVRAWKARVESPTLTESLAKAHSPSEGGLVLAWRSRPSVGNLDSHIAEVVAALAR